VSCSTRGDNILDLLLTTHPDFVSSVEVIDSLPVCDHDAIHFTLSATISVLYNYKAVIINDLKEVLSRVCWDIIDFDSDDTEGLILLICQLYCSYCSLEQTKNKALVFRVYHQVRRSNCIVTTGVLVTQSH